MIGYPFNEKERLRRGRKERRGRAIVVVGIVDIVRVELELVVVEVEVRGVIEAIIVVRRIVFAHPCHQSSKVILVGNKTPYHS